MKKILLQINFILILGLFFNASIIAQENYQLKIAGVQVTQTNASNLSEIEGVEGTVTYDNSTKTLTLNNASITTTDSKNGIHNIGIENLKIILIDSNTINSKYACIKTSVPTEINGTGSLTATATGAMGILMYKTLTIKNCSIETSGTKWGIDGYNGLSGEHLIIDKATLKATGTTVGAIMDIANLTLTECGIVAPSGAYFDKNLYGITINGQEVVKGQVVIAPSTAIKDISETDIKVYPNPITKNLHIKTTEELKSIELYNTNGQLILKTQKTSNISVSQLPKGIYIIKINTEKGVFSSKIIKQ